MIVRYTSPDLVSKATGGEIAPEEVLPEWIDAAMEEIESTAGMSFRPVLFTDVLDGNGQDYAFTRRFPVLAITRLEDEGTEIPSSAYVVNKRTGRITLRNGFFTPGVQNLVVEGTAGMTSVPALVQKIATLLVAKTALSAKNGPLIDNESIGDFNQTRTFKKLNDELDRAWAALGRRFPLDFV
jgi:hypothetical protein